MSDLHAAIMNMDPREGPSDFGDHLDEQLDAAYKRGFRDARHAAAELAALAPAVPQWMPIETAPKDGTPVLVREARCSGFAVMYSGGWKYESGNICYLEPTHWMPLPDAPKETT